MFTRINKKISKYFYNFLPVWAKKKKSYNPIKNYIKSVK